MRYVYGVCNAAFYALRAEGDVSWYSSRSARDAALVALREEAVERGLSQTAATAGIYPVRRHVGSEAGRAWLDALEDAAAGGRDRPGVTWRG